MECQKCYGRNYEDENELNTVDFGPAGDYIFCDECSNRAYDYLSDFL